MTDRCDECGNPPEWCRCEIVHPSAHNLPTDEEKETGLDAIRDIRKQLGGEA